jgi:hypothetical protein
MATTVLQADFQNGTRTVVTLVCRKTIVRVRKYVSYLINCAFNV